MRRSSRSAYVTLFSSFAETILLGLLRAFAGRTSGPADACWGAGSWRWQRTPPRPDRGRGGALRSGVTALDGPSESEAHLMLLRIRDCIASRRERHHEASGCRVAVDAPEPWWRRHRARWLPSRPTNECPSMTSSSMSRADSPSRSNRRASSSPSSGSTRMGVGTGLWLFGTHPDTGELGIFLLSGRFVVSIDAQGNESFRRVGRVTDLCAHSPLEASGAGRPTGLPAPQRPRGASGGTGLAWSRCRHDSSVAP